MGKQINYYNSKDKKAYKEVFDQHFKSLCVFALNYVPSIEIAEDIVQDIFIKIWEKGYSFETSNAFKSFAYTSAKNNCLTFLKHKKVVEKHISENPPEDENFFNNILEEEVIGTVYQEVEKLPEQSRKIILLSMQGLKNNEIAEDLGISINTVKTLKKNSYKKLKENLTGVQHYRLLAILF